MKDDRLEISLDYMKFTIEADGEVLSDELSEAFRGIIEDGGSADKAIASYIRSEALSGNSYSGEDEMSVYPGTRCLVNYFGIKDKPQLRRIDKRISSFRTAELLRKPLDMPFSFEHLVAIHSHLFGDIYPSAGMIRTSASKKHREYCQPDYIIPSAEKLFDNLRSSHYLRGITDTDDFINELAYYMGEVEALHPFLDGNGRVTRAISDHILAAHDGCSKGCYSMSAQIFRVRNSYYDILERTEKGGMDITPWLSWFALCFTRAIEAGRETLARIVEGVRVLEHASAFELNERQSRVLGRLTENFQGKLTEEKYARLAKCSPVAAEADIAELIRYGILQETDESGRRPSFVLAHR